MPRNGSRPGLDRHSRPPGRHHGPLDSPFIEALSEWECASADELQRLVSQHRPDLAPVLREISLVTSEPAAAVQLLRIREGIRNLQQLEELIHLGVRGKAVVILPLPPHVMDRLLPVTAASLIFSSEEDLPPHFPQNCRNLDDLMPDDVLRQFADVEALVLDGYEERDQIFVRRSVLRTLQIMGRTTRLFLHSLPHRPHHCELSRLEGEWDVAWI